MPLEDNKRLLHSKLLLSSRAGSRYLSVKCSMEIAPGACPSGEPLGKVAPDAAAATRVNAANGRG